MGNMLAALLRDRGGHARGGGFAIAAGDDDFLCFAGTNHGFQDIGVDAPRDHAGQTCAAAHAQQATCGANQFSCRNCER